MGCSKRACGFTLIEVVIVMAIIGIIAAISFGSYSDSVQKSRRTDGKDALVRAAAEQEKWFLQYSRYTDQISDIGGSTSKEGNYTLSVVMNLNGTACSSHDCYTLTATAANAQAGDSKCTRLVLDSLGRQTSYNSSSALSTDLCW